MFIKFNITIQNIHCLFYYKNFQIDFILEIDRISM